jgi:hypothetical protein
MGDRAVDCARLESVCAARHQGFESPPIRFPPAIIMLPIDGIQEFRSLSNPHNPTVDLKFLAQVAPLHYLQFLPQF